MRRLLGGFACIALGACNLLTGASDLDVGGTCEPSCDAADAAGPDGSLPTPNDGSTTTDSATSDAAEDARVDGGTEGGKIPGYCTGATIYVKFDGNANSADGQGPVGAVVAPYVAGKFGQALNFNGGTTVYYASGVAGLPSRADTNVGTMMLWFKGTWAFPGNAGRTFIRTKENTDNGAGLNGPAIDLSGGRFGTVVPNEIQASFDPALLVATWKVNDWNHIAATWSTTTAPNMTFSLNGGDSVGGKTASTAQAWTPPLPANYIRVGSAATPIDGYVDDVIVWTRALSAAEIAAIYTDGVAGRSFGTSCGK